jgi:hypothetical protein
MKNRFKLVTILLFVLLCAGAFLTNRVQMNASAAPELPLSDTASQQGKTAEQVYKNIQVLKGVPASQLQGAMSFMADSLGVGCSHCHSKSFDADDKPTKQTARKMIRMVFDLNKGSSEIFSGSAVSCFTCHRGQPDPVSVPVITSRPSRNTGTQTSAVKPEKALPSVEQVLDKYIQALGGKAALAKLKTRLVKGSRVGADGVLVPEELYQKSPDKLLVMTSYPNVTFQSGFNGTQAWARDGRGGDQINDQFAEALKREAEFFNAVRLRELYPKMTVVSRATVGDRETYVISATTSDGGEKLFFDAQTGLLVRRYLEFETVLGQTPVQVDYEDYREVDGVKLPFQLRWSNPRYSWGRKIDQIKHNVSMDDGKFNPPAIK